MNVATNRWVGLFSFSLSKSFTFGFGVMVALTLDSVSSGSSALLGALGLSRKPSNALIWIRGHVVAFNVAISCDGLSVMDSQARPLQALPVCLWATSRSSKTSHNRFCWLSVSDTISFMDSVTSSPLGHLWVALPTLTFLLFPQFWVLLPGTWGH